MRWNQCGQRLLLLWCATHLIAALGQSSQQQETKYSQESIRFYTELGPPWQLYRAGKLKDAEAGFRAVGEEAAQAGNNQAQAWVHNALGQVMYQEARYPEARAEFEHSLDFYALVDDPAGTAGTHDGLGNVLRALGNNDLAAAHYRAALNLYRKSGSLRDVAVALNHLQNIGDSEPEKLEQEALAIARQLGDRELEAEVLQDTGDRLFGLSRFDQAQQNYEQAAADYLKIGDKQGLAYVLTSEGRLQRAHGRPDKSLELYREALKLQREAGDRFGEIQSTNAIAVAYEYLGRNANAVRFFEKALNMAQATGSERVINFERANLAEALTQVGRAREAVAILKEQVQLDSPYRAGRYAELSDAYFHLRQYRQAKDAADQALQLASGDTDPDFFLSRARAESKLGQSKEALADAMLALQQVESHRTHLVTNDSMKRGFAESTQEFFRFAIRLSLDAGQFARALEIAEEARSRAFLDLLATRDLEGRLGTEVSALQKVRDQLAGLHADVSQVDPPPGDQLQDPSTADLWARWMKAGPQIRSLVSVQPGSLVQFQATARRLGSTILSYWVSDSETDIWVLSPGGELHVARVPIGAAALKRKIGSLWRGEVPVVVGDSPARGAATPGGGTATPDGTRPWQELYHLLIRPIEKWLPPKTGSLITIESHGPLQVLPFAALRNEAGQYLIERFTLHSVPAITLLPFTEKKQASARENLKYTLVAAPEHTPAGPDGKPLPDLPGARREVASIARMLPASQVALLQGHRVNEKELADLASASRVLHFATHGVILNDRPLDSFLAFDTASPGPSAGRFTVQKIYGLELNADLVFLSFCRSGLGAVSGDGIEGLTRAFFYAGASSVIATVWDVADETAHRLVTAFYSHWLKSGDDKARALRLAQLELLRDLRAGKVTVQTTAGKVTLTENPVFWASFVLQGEP